MPFKLISKFKPTGDQPQAIEKLAANLQAGASHQTLLGVTGSGKTFTIANVIERVQRPTLVISHNKTLAAQLFEEFKEFFPENAVHYFVSYYDYYQPEAYIPQTDTYIEKDAKVNDVIDALRHASTASLLTRRDVIIVASVSCIYGIGSPTEYKNAALELSVGQKISQKELAKHLVRLQYARNALDPRQGHFRARENMTEIYLPSGEEAVVVGIEKGKIVFLERRLGNILHPTSYKLQAICIFPAKHFVTPQDKLELALENVIKELRERLNVLKKEGKIIEAARLKQRTEFDLEMLKSVGYVNGIENYSRHLDFRMSGTPPHTLIDYFNYAYRGAQENVIAREQRDRSNLRKSPRSLRSLAITNNKENPWLCVIDESHATIPQLRGMYNGDRARKQTLVDYGWRLPSAIDNRPLKFEEFNKKIGQVVYMSATPGEYEIQMSRNAPLLAPLEKSFQTGQEGEIPRFLGTGSAISRDKRLLRFARNDHVVEQLIRPTGILEPKIKIRPTKNQMQDVIKEIKIRAAEKERSLVMALTKRLAEDITDYLSDAGINAEYLHSEIKTLERPVILRKLRTGERDVIVGINLLREGLDLPEVSFIAILDADKEGFLRNKTTLLQIIGRAARHANGTVILYADHITGSIKEAMQETERRRKIQEAHNNTYGIIPRHIKKDIRPLLLERKKEVLLPEGAPKEIARFLASEMKRAAKELDFERAAQMRDMLKKMGSP